MRSASAMAVLCTLLLGATPGSGAELYDVTMRADCPITEPVRFAECTLNDAAAGARKHVEAIVGTGQPYAHARVADFHGCADHAAICNVGLRGIHEIWPESGAVAPSYGILYYQGAPVMECVIFPGSWDECHTSFPMVVYTGMCHKITATTVAANGQIYSDSIRWPDRAC